MLTHDHHVDREGFHHFEFAVHIDDAVYYKSEIKPEIVRTIEQYGVTTLLSWEPVSFDKETGFEFFHIKGSVM
jgi:hypothetical protein